MKKLSPIKSVKCFLLVFILVVSCIATSNAKEVGDYEILLQWKHLMWQFENKAQEE